MVTPDASICALSYSSEKGSEELIALELHEPLILEDGQDVFVAGNQPHTSAVRQGDAMYRVTRTQLSVGRVRISLEGGIE